MENIKEVPKFDSEVEERKFWERTDSTEHIDWSKAERAVFPNLRPTRAPDEDGKEKSGF